MTKSFISRVERVEIELTNTCNLDCVLCARNRVNISENLKIDLDNLKDKLNTFKNLKYVTLAGEISEPTLYPRLFELITFLHRKNIEISLFTNATKSNIYFRNLALLFKNTKSKIYLTIFGSNEDLHRRYRKSSLRKVLEIADIIYNTSPKNLVMTWVLFQYNYQDYIENKDFLDKYNEVNVFNTLPYAERYGIDGDIRLPNDLDKIYLSLDKNDLNGECKSIKNRFAYIDVNLNEYPCSLAKHHKCSFEDISENLQSFCYECSDNNIKILSDNKIYTISESENETSEKDLYIESR